MSTKLRNPLLAALIAGMTVSLAAPMASAQQNGAQNCIILPNGKKQCNPAPQRAQPAQPGAPGNGAQRATPPQNNRVQSQQQIQQQYQIQQQQRIHAPAIGDNVRRAPVFQQAKNSRLPPPPAHQHYRVIDGTIVRVDDNTLKVVAVVGLLDAILNSK